MTIEGHYRDFKEDHSRRKEKENAKANSMKMSQDQIDRERAYIKFHLEFLMELLQRNVKYQRHGWTMRNNVKWQRLHAKREKKVNIQLTEELRKLEQMISVQMRCQEIREVVLKMDVSICGSE